MVRLSSLFFCVKIKTQKETRSFAQHIPQKNKGELLELLQKDAIFEEDKRYFFSREDELNKAWNEVFSGLEL